MPREHVSLSDVGLTPRAVTRRDALRLLIGAGLCATFLPGLASAETTQEKLDAAQMSYDQAQEELDKIGNEVAAIAEQLSQTQGQVVEVGSQIEQMQADIDSTQQQIEQRQADIETKQEALGQRMSSAYKSGPQSTIDMLLSSATFEDLTSNIYYLDKVSASDREMIDEVKTLKADLESQKADLESQKADLEERQGELQALQAQQQQELADQQAKQQEATDLVSGLSQDVQDLMAQRDAELLAAQQAAEEAKKAEEAARKQQANGTGGGSAGGSNAGGSQTITGSGSLAAVQAAAYSTPSPGSGLCAAWVTSVFRNAGVGHFGGNACDMYWSWCYTSPSNAQPGMIIAVPYAPFSAAVRIYGHVGIYLGNNTVRDNASGVLRTSTLSGWASEYSAATVLCGWLGGVALS